MAVYLRKDHKYLTAKNRDNKLILRYLMTLTTTQVSESVSPICPSHDSVVDTVNPSFPPSLIPTSIPRDGPLDLLSPFQHIASPLTETTSMEDLNNIDQESRELLPGDNMVRSI